MFIDTHCHLDFEQFNDDREKVIQRAIKNNIHAIITIGTDVKSSKASIRLAENFATIFAAVGIHPGDCNKAGETDFVQIEELAENDAVVAIGEVGLDYYRMHAPKEIQQSFFKAQIQIARKMELPLIIHNREAHEDILKLVREENANHIGGVFHSFSGDIEFLEAVIAENFHVSFTGVVTFKNANLDEVVKAVPTENLLLETDSPFLAPVPFRGKRNEPGYLKYTAEKIAQVKGVSIEELAEITSANAKLLFNLTD